MQTEFQIGDHVLYILDGDIGIVSDVDYSNRSHVGLEPYYIEWFLHPEQSGWHSAFDCDDSSKQVMIHLGGNNEGG
jgi:endo-beta-N-acetylglucosaminidase D